MNIQQNIQEIKKITSDSVKIVAVTKNRSLDDILEVINCGVTDIGENRLQEAKNKLSDLPKDIIKHFIGRLQSNKVKDVIKLFDVIQSMDSIKVAEKINKECENICKIMPILIQVNTSSKTQQGGIDPNEAIGLIKKASQLRNIKIEGLMTIAINSNNSEDVRYCFKKLKNLFDEIRQKNIPRVDMKWLSMGMSGDYKLALDCGTTMIRIGSSLFR